MSNIVIVGADQGIGYYLVQSLLEAGNRVAVMDIRTEHIEQLHGKYPDTLMILYADATDEASIVEGVRKAHESFGSIDIAIHNACLCTFESEPDSGIEIYQKVMDVNYYGALRLAKAVLPFMRKAEGGRLIFTSSGVGVTGFENISPYASSKGAIEALANVLKSRIANTVSQSMCFTPRLPIRNPLPVCRYRKSLRQILKRSGKAWQSISTRRSSSSVQVSPRHCRCLCATGIL